MRALAIVSFPILILLHTHRCRRIHYLVRRCRLCCFLRTRRLRRLRCRLRFIRRLLRRLQHLIVLFVSSGCVASSLSVFRLICFVGCAAAAVVGAFPSSSFYC